MTARITIATVMSRQPVTFSPTLEINHAVARLLACHISGAPVVDAAGQLVGIITAKDCFKAALNASYYQGWGGVVADYMSPSVQTMDIGLDIVSAAERFLASPFRRFPVLEDGVLVGIVTRLDLLRAFYRQW
jgi:CBS domain-containing protein